MNIIFVRHGESEDDLINAYGGWADFPITENGKKQIGNTARRIKDLNIEISKIISSPLSRAKSTSEILAKELNLDIEIYEYLKERNSYGIMSGMNKEEAKHKYPDQVQNLENNLFVDGSERIEDLRIRVEKVLQFLNTQKGNLIVVSHGSFLKELFISIGMQLVKKEDGGLAVIELKDGKFKLVLSSGLDFES